MRNWSSNLEGIVDEVTLDESFKLSKKPRFENFNFATMRKPAGGKRR